jgi:predicted nuclease of predicted toxin-antitoxin system
MSQQVRFHLDEHIPHTIATALRRLSIDVTTTSEAGLREADDLSHLEFTRREGRVLVTQDADFLRYHAQGIPHAGVKREVARLVK